MTYSLIIVDDETVSLEGLSTLIDWTSLGFGVAGTFSDGAEAITYLETNAADVVLTDIKMTQVSGIDLAAWIHEHHPETRIVLISAHKSFDYAKEALKYGVVYYLLKPFPLKEIDELFTSIRENLDAASEDPEDDSTGASDAITLVTNYIESHFAEHLTLENLASRAFLSPGYLSRLFSARTGQSLSSFISGVRVEKAKDLLVSTRLHVYEVCHSVGYSDLKHFYSTFKKHTGKTPAAYRKSNRHG
jgi:YesN/AraC family two-component response regulator